MKFVSTGGLFCKVISIGECIANVIGEWRIGKYLEGIVRPVIDVQTGLCLQWLRKNTKTCSKDIQHHARD
jgi:hypothetical protein